jgi:hypothetical protein
MSNVNLASQLSFAESPTPIELTTPKYLWPKHCASPHYQVTERWVYQIDFVYMLPESASVALLSEPLTVPLELSLMYEQTRETHGTQSFEPLILLST